MSARSPFVEGWELLSRFAADAGESRANSKLFRSSSMTSPVISSMGVSRA